MFLPLAFWQKGLIMALVFLQGIYFCWHYALLRSPTSVVALYVNQKNQLTITLKNGKQCVVFVKENTVVTANLIVLNVQLQEANFWQRLLTKYIVIFPDAPWPIRCDNYVFGYAGQSCLLQTKTDWLIVS